MTVRVLATATGTNPAATNASSVTVNKPAGTVEGNLMLAVTSAVGSTVTPPAGWTELGSLQDTTVLRSTIFKKRAGAAEPANYTFTFGLSGANVVSITTLVGAHDVVQQDLDLTNAEDPAIGRTVDAPVDCVALQYFAWRDNATATISIGHGAENFDVAIDGTGSTIWRGLCGTYYGPPGLNDIVNAGDEMPSNSFDQSQTVGWGIASTVLVAPSPPDTEHWSSTNGDFAVEVKLDDVELDSTGGITTEFKCDVTTQVANITASLHNPPNEADDKAADGLLTTKWVAADPTGWLQYDFGSGVTKTIRRYRLTSGDDFVARDPMNWTLQGSNNGTDFTVLDTRTDHGFANRLETAEFRVTTPGAYRYYRLNITQNNGSANLQLAEFRLSTCDIWEDITPFVVADERIRITRGFQGTSGRHDYTRAYYTLNNTDGRFSTRNQNGAYFGALQRNTQTRISKAHGTKSLQLQGAVELAGTNMTGDGIRTPMTSALQITGDLDIRIDCEAETWRAEQMLAGVSTAPGTSSWHLHLIDSGQVVLRRRPTGFSETTLTSTLAVPQKTRQAIRVTADVDNGAGGTTVTFYTAETIAGPWTQLGDPVTNTTSTAATNYPGGALCVGHVGSKNERGLHGMVYHFELRSGIDGTLVSDIDFTAQTNGARTFTESGNTWTAVNNAIISNRRYRFHGEVSEWPLSWDTTGTWITASATGAGIQKRLERGGAEESTMRRYHTKGIISDPGAFERHADPYAYWPMEDEENSFEIASALPGKPSMQVYGNPDYSSFSDFQESAPLPLLKNAKIGGRVAGNSSGYADIRWMMHTEEAITANANILTLYSSGALKKLTINYTAANQWRIQGFDEGDTGTPTWNPAAFTVSTVGELLHAQLILDDSGANLSVELNVYDAYGTPVSTQSLTFTTSSLGRVYRVNFNDGATVKMNEVAIGHCAVYGFDAPVFTDPLNSYQYERAGERIQRLCQEEEIEFRIIGEADKTKFMGFQNVGSPFANMTTPASTDQGYLIDPLDAFGMEYRTGRSLLNQPAHLTLSYTGNELSGELRPTEDDSYIVNDFTASRGGAGGARFRLDEGPLSVNPPPLGVGEYNDQSNFSLANEGACVDLASWEVHKGTLDEERYPRIEVALENARIAADDALAERVLLTDVGDRLDIVDTPDFLPAHDIRQVIIGYEEWFDNFQHGFRMNCIPERVFETAEYDSWHHFDTDNTVLYQDTTSSAETLTLQVNNGPKWTQDPESMPFNLQVNGEHIRVVGTGTEITENAWFDNGITGWSAGTATLSASTEYVHPHPDATTSLKIVPDGSLANARAASPLPGKPVTPGNRYVACGWVLAPLGYDAARVTVNWYDAAQLYISTSSVTSDAIPAAKWTFLEEIVTAPSNAATGIVLVGFTNSPTAGEIGYWWGCRIQDIPVAHAGSYLMDSFDRANNATSLGSSNGGLIQAWTATAGTWGIDANQAYISAAATSYATQSGASDLEEVSVTVSSWASGTAHLLFRFTDASNHVRWGGTVGSAPILEFLSGGVVVRTVTADAALFTLAAGQKLSARCNGSVVEAFINDELAICVTETAQMSATRVGMRVTTTVPRFNNFYVETSDALQSYAVERSRNGVVLAHKANSGVSLAKPPYRGL